MKQVSENFLNVEIGSKKKKERNSQERVEEIDDANSPLKEDCQNNTSKHPQIPGFDQNIPNEKEIIRPTPQKENQEQNDRNQVEDQEDEVLQKPINSKMRRVVPIALVLLFVLVAFLATFIIYQNRSQKYGYAGQDRVDISPSNSEAIVTNQVLQQDPKFLGEDKIYFYSHVVKKKDQIGTQMSEYSQHNEYGMVDYHDEQKGITIRFLTPTNIYLYAYIQKIESWIRKNDPQKAKQITVDDIKTFLIDILKQIKNVEQFSIEAQIQEVWNGKYNPETKQYTIELKSSEVEESNIQMNNLQTEEGVKALKQMFKSIGSFVKDKIRYVKKHAKQIMQSLGFSFDQNTDLYVREEKMLKKQKRKDENNGKDSQNSQEYEGEANENNQQNGQIKQTEQHQQEMMMDPQIMPKEPITYVKTFTPMLYQRPSSIENSNVINKQTFDSMISCIQLSKDIKSCTKQEWLSDDTPYIRSKQSKEQQENYKTQKRIRVNLKK